MTDLDSKKFIFELAWGRKLSDEQFFKRQWRVYASEIMAYRFTLLENLVLKASIFALEAWLHG